MYGGAYFGFAYYGPAYWGQGGPPGQTITSQPSDSFSLTENMLRDFFGDRAASGMQEVFAFAGNLDANTIITRSDSVAGGSFFQQINRAFIGDRLPQETFTFSDSPLRDLVLDRLLQDANALADQLVADIIVHSRDLQDTFTFTDQQIRDLVLDRFIADARVFVENLDRDATGDVDEVEHWRLKFHHRWAERRRMLRNWMSRTNYPPT